MKNLCCKASFRVFAVQELRSQPVGTMGWDIELLSLRKRATRKARKALKVWKRGDQDIFPELQTKEGYYGLSPRSWTGIEVPAASHSSSRHRECKILGNLRWCLPYLNSLCVTHCVAPSHNLLRVFQIRLKDSSVASTICWQIFKKLYFLMREREKREGQGRGEERRAEERRNINLLSLTGDHTPNPGVLGWCTK